MRLPLGVGFAVTLLASVAPARAAAIDLSAQADVFFSDPLRPDHFSATLKGNSCDDAEYTYTISRAGVELFRRVVPMAQIFQCDQVAHQSEETHWAALQILNGAVAAVRACDRGCGGPHAIGCWVAPNFERLQKADASLMCFATGSEASACVAYDPEAKAVVEVRRHSD
jgi:hypothetical protein